MSRQEVEALPVLYPEYLREEIWKHLEEGNLQYDAFRMRD